MTSVHVDLATRIATARAKAAQPAWVSSVSAESVDVEAWNHVGDPIAEDLVTYLRERKLMGGDILATARRLRAEAVAVADAFLTDVEWVPQWANFDAMRPGAALGLRHPFALALSIHGALPLTYVDGSVARVMASTGRLTTPGSDFRRRFYETAAGFVGAFDVEGMKPGGRRWEQWVRIRLLHTQIRMGILRSGRWDTTQNLPISQAPTAAGPALFGTQRVNIIRFLGGRVRDEEADSFELMWRWIARIEGANTELLGTTATMQRLLNRRIAEHLYCPTEDSGTATAAVIAGLAEMRREFPVSRRTHVGIVRALLSPDMVAEFLRDGPALATLVFDGAIGLKFEPMFEGFPFGLQIVPDNSGWENIAYKITDPEYGILSFWSAGFRIELSG